MTLPEVSARQSRRLFDIAPDRVEFRGYLEQTRALLEDEEIVLFGEKSKD